MLQSTLVLEGLIINDGTIRKQGTENPKQWGEAQEKGMEAWNSVILYGKTS